MTGEDPLPRLHCHRRERADSLSLARGWGGVNWFGGDVDDCLKNSSATYLDAKTVRLAGRDRGWLGYAAFGCAYVVLKTRAF